MPGAWFNNPDINSKVQKYLEKRLTRFPNLKYAYAIMSKKKSGGLHHHLQPSGMV